MEVVASFTLTVARQSVADLMVAGQLTGIGSELWGWAIDWSEADWPGQRSFPGSSSLNLFVVLWDSLPLNVVCF